MKVVCDTNVLVSAFLTTTGPSAYIVQWTLKHFELIVSEYILEEIRSKLSTKLKIPKAKVDLLEKFLRRRSNIVQVKSSRKIAFPDPKDIPILTLLRIHKPHFFVTGDKKLLNLKKFDHVLILSPREAMEVFHSIA